MSWPSSLCQKLSNVFCAVHDTHVSVESWQARSGLLVMRFRLICYGMLGSVRRLHTGVVGLTGLLTGGVTPTLRAARTSRADGALRAMYTSSCCLGDTVHHPAPSSHDRLTSSGKNGNNRKL